MITLRIHRVDNLLRIHNMLGHLLAVTDGMYCDFKEKVTNTELSRINAICQDYENYILNIPEE
jgi:hypothetical protein